MSLAQETVNKLLDFNQKLDIGLLDNVVGTLYSGTGDQQRMAQEVLTTLKEHPEAWTKVRRQTTPGREAERSRSLFFLGRHHPRVFEQPADKVLRPPNSRERHQDPVEDFAEEPVRGDQEVHRRPHHQDEVSRFRVRRAAHWLNVIF
jgi:hypothetical protein